MSEIKIIPVVYGKSVLGEDQIFKGGDSKKVQPIDFKVFVLKTDKKTILVDGGCDTMPGFEMKDFIGPVAALEKIGIKPDDITDVIITHSHHDHIEGVSHFKDAAVYIQKDEFEDGKGYLLQNKNVITFDETFEVCKGVKIIKIGGHSKGSCIAEIKTDGKIYIICGDECYKRECITKGIPTGASYCPEKSLEFIKKYSLPKYNLLLCHD